MVVRGLTVLLLPWTLLLALAPTEHWFGTAWLKWGWVLFDLAVAAGLLRFLYKRSTSSLTLLVAAVTFDAVLTLLQAVLWNLPRARSVFDYVVIGLACLAPLVACVVLWGARRFRLTDS